MEKKVTIRRKDLPTYTENPSILKMRTGQKAKALTKANKAWVAEDTGEYYDRAGLWEVQEVDDAPFVKLYVGAIRAFNDLTKTGARLLEVVFHELEQNKDLVFLNPNVVKDYNITERVFYNAINELCVKEILFESSRGLGWYFINVNFIFNGDRLVIAKEYRRKRTNKFNDPNQLNLL
jgi:hypothetical protein